MIAAAQPHGSHASASVEKISQCFRKAIGRDSQDNFSLGKMRREHWRTGILCLPCRLSDEVKTGRLRFCCQDGVSLALGNSVLSVSRSCGLVTCWARQVGLGRQTEQLIRPDLGESVKLPLCLGIDSESLRKQFELIMQCVLVTFLVGEMRYLTPSV